MDRLVEKIDVEADGNVVSRLEIVETGLYGVGVTRLFDVGSADFFISEVKLSGVSAIIGYFQSIDSFVVINLGVSECRFSDRALKIKTYDC